MKTTSSLLRCAKRRSFQPSLRRHYADYQSAATSSTNTTDEEIASSRKYCVDMLRKYDTPSFLLQTYIPQHARDAYVAIRAFNIDVARTADTTSTPTVGSMRLQFQRDAVSQALAGKPPKQPIAVLLSRAVEDLTYQSSGKAKFSKSWFNRVINTREQHLSNPPFTSLASLETYAENTYSTLMYLTLQSLPVASVSADHLASHIGKATGIATLLRGLPLIAFPPSQRHNAQESFGGSVGTTRQGAVLLPLDIMAQYGVREEDVLRSGGSAKGLKDAVFAVATRANDHLITAREMLKNVRAGQDEGHEFEHAEEAEHVYEQLGLQGVKMTPKQEIERSFGVFLPAVATSLWLQRLEKFDFDVFEPKLRMTDWRLPWKAWWAYTRKQI